MMEKTADFMGADVAPIWTEFVGRWSEVLWSELTEPSIATLFALALLSGTISRSLIMFVGATALAGAGLYLQHHHDLLLDLRVAGALIGAQAIFLLGGWVHFQHAGRMRLTVQDLENENRELQSKLDREVLWRISGHHEASTSGPTFPA